MFKWDNLIEYKGIKLLDGRSSRPCSHEPIGSHDYEYDMFMSILEHIDRSNPTMIELGSYWAFWSLCFRKKFPEGKNILVELGKRQLSIGRKNFELNGFNETHYWGGLHIDNSNVYEPSVRESNYNYANHGGYWDTSLVGKMTGPEIAFEDIYSIEGLDVIDLLHVDIQGSEYPLIVNLHAHHPEILNKIQNIIIATHSPSIQRNLLQILVESGMKILKNEPFGTIGGDGMIALTRN